MALEAERQRYQAGNVQKTFDLVTTQQRAVVILNVSPPDRAGLEVLTCLKQIYPTRPVLMFSVPPECQYAVRAMQNGAAGYFA